MLFLVAQTFFLLVVATMVGVGAGWLIWGGSKRSGAPSANSLPGAALTSELEQSQAEVDARTSDVARLRRKLKRAVEELERLAMQLEAAEEQITSLSSGSSPMAIAGLEGESSVVDDAQFVALRGELEESQAAHRSVTEELESVQADLDSASDQLVSVHARSEAALKEVAELERHANEARSASADATARIVYLEEQALLWQNEADRLQAVVDDMVIAQASEVQALDARLAAVQHDHDTQVAQLRAEVSDHRMRAEASSEQLDRLKSEIRSFRERSQAHLEASRAMMADLDQQLAAATTAMSHNPQPTALTVDANAHRATGPEFGLERLPGITAGLVAHLGELGVASLADVARWSPDDVARISSWLPESRDIIGENNWVETARSLLTDGSIVTTNGA